jgi:hypothetical protein
MAVAKLQLPQPSWRSYPVTWGNLQHSKHDMYVILSLSVDCLLSLSAANQSTDSITAFDCCTAGGEVRCSEQEASG